MYITCTTFSAEKSYSVARGGGDTRYVSDFIRAVHILSLIYDSSKIDSQSLATFCNLPGEMCGFISIVKGANIRVSWLIFDSIFRKALFSLKCISWRHIWLEKWKLALGL